MRMPGLTKVPWLALALVVLGGSAAGVAAGGAVTSGLGSPAAAAEGPSWAERFHQSPAAPADDYAGGAMVSEGASPPSYDGYPPADPAPQAAPDPRDVQRVADECADCSDYDLGYRWAENHRIGDVSRCLGFSWSYQRGCLAYAREGRGEEETGT